ncbi:probable glutathione S-transferase GSTF1 [Phoenix dactylifera]|uniref:glutathione transferase n=1 Tax=Phoenix dactylifera TaxID=42345 RepID=A0A8B7CSY2_PHODC|nr:probable glutathione S-transferase GSTF1 [Phoenix dactylifera]XP_038977382.1 probable glutathione S-transferase GSTF1 [Phoenix dactylifera]
MGVKVYGATMSTCTARVLLCLEEMGAEYELVPIDFSTGEHKQPAHLARNPFGQVPAFEDGALILYESRAIARYILRKYKSSGGDLLKEGSLEESAMVDLWLEVESQQFNPAIGPIFYQIFIFPRFGNVPDQAVIDTNLEKLCKVLDVYEARLSKTKYLAGDFFSLADLSHVPLLHYFMATPHASVVNSRPHVKAWWEGVSSRPACKKVTAAMPASA